MSIANGHIIIFYFAAFENVFCAVFQIETCIEYLKILYK